MTNITKGTIIRTIVLIFALTNQGLTIAGKSPLPFDDAAVAEGVSMILTAAASLWAWWKNNSFTRSAIAADQYRAERNEGDETIQSRIERMK